MKLSLSQRIKAFEKLGKLLGGMDSSGGELRSLLQGALQANQWFTPQQVMNRINSLSAALKKEKLEAWLTEDPEAKEDYGSRGNKENAPKSNTIAIVVPANLPLVGFDDFATVLLTGNKLLAKVSRREGGLLKFLTGKLMEIEPGFGDMIEFIQGDFPEPDAVIATGSDNTARYFEYEYRKLPTLIRRNRNGVAILDGTESPEELKELGRDIFGFFGLGCRSVSKIYVPEGYDIVSLAKYWKNYSGIIEHKGYNNNYRYQGAIEKMKATVDGEGKRFTDTGFLILKESSSLSSPIASLHYEHYGKRETVEKMLRVQEEKIQCIIGHGHIPFGKAQEPEWNDYADGTDTVKFLTDL